MVVLKSQTLIGTSLIAQNEGTGGQECKFITTYLEMAVIQDQN